MQGVNCYILIVINYFSVVFLVNACNSKVIIIPL